MVVRSYPLGVIEMYFLMYINQGSCEAPLGLCTPGKRPRSKRAAIDGWVVMALRDSSALVMLYRFVNFAGLSLQCYACNSANDPSCDDPFKHYTIGVINCSMREKPEHLDPEHRESKVCRKTVQYGIMMSF